MSWRVLFRQTARDELAEIYSYISTEHEDPAMAQAVVNRLLDSAQGLSQAPLARRLHPDEELLKLGVRYLVVGSYVELFTVSTEDSIVVVHHIWPVVRDAPANWAHS